MLSTQVMFDVPASNDQEHIVFVMSAYFCLFVCCQRYTF